MSLLITVMQFYVKNVHKALIHIYLLLVKAESCSGPCAHPPWRVCVSLWGCGGLLAWLS